MGTFGELLKSFTKNIIKFIAIALAIIVGGQMVLYLLLLILSIGMFAFVPNTVLIGESYNSIEELHQELVVAMKLDENVERDIWYEELVYYFEVDDIVIMVSTFSDCNGKVCEEELDLFVVEKEDGKYIIKDSFEGPHLRLYLGSEYTMGGDYYYFKNVEINDEKRSMCCLYKDINETRSLYFDGVKTEEVIINNPFDGTQFSLCYGFSKQDNILKKLAVDIGNRHKVELK